MTESAIDFFVRACQRKAGFGVVKVGFVFHVEPAGGDMTIRARLFQKGGAELFGMRVFMAGFAGLGFQLRPAIGRREDSFLLVPGRVTLKTVEF